MSVFAAYLVVRVYVQLTHGTLVLLLRLLRVRNDLEEVEKRSASESDRSKSSVLERIQGAMLNGRAWTRAADR